MNTCELAIQDRHAVAWWPPPQPEVLSEDLTLADGVYYANIHLASQAAPIRVALHGIRSGSQALQVLQMFHSPLAALSLS